jgi:hypothetical protein
VNQKYSGKPFSSAPLSITNPTWHDPGSNPCHRGGKPATNRLSYGTTCRKFKKDTLKRGLLSISSGINILAYCLLFITKDLTGPSPVFFFPLYYFLHTPILFSPKMRRNRISIKIHSSIPHFYRCSPRPFSEVNWSRLSFPILLLILSTRNNADVPSKRNRRTIISIYNCVKQKNSIRSGSRDCRACVYFAKWAKHVCMGLTRPYTISEHTASCTSWESESVRERCWRGWYPVVIKSSSRLTI